MSGGYAVNDSDGAPNGDRLRDGMSVDVVIVCHVENGYATSRSVIFEKRRREGSIDGVRNAILLSDRVGATISFVIMPEVLEAFDGFDFMNNEIGLHIHPEDLLLMEKGLGGFHRPLREYGFEEQRSMISVGKQLVIDSLGITPRTFVAGKWSVGNETVRALVELGFTHDASACPQFSGGSCDWTRLPRICMPYRPSRYDYQTTGDMQITMVPVSKEITSGILGPENTAGLGLLKAALHEYVDLGVPFLHIAFHSPAMISRHYRDVFSRLLRWTSDLGGNFRRLSEIQPVRAEIPPNARRLSPYLMNADTSTLSHVLLHAIKNPRHALDRLRHQLAREPEN